MGTLMVSTYLSTFKEEIVPIFYNLCQSIEVEGKLPNSFYEASTIPKSYKGTPRKTNKPKLQANVFQKHTCKIFQQNIGNRTQRCIKNNYPSEPIGIYPKYAGLVQHLKIN